jgi:RecG-like helicase
VELEKNQLKKYNIYEEIHELPHAKQPVDTKWVLHKEQDQMRNLIKRQT